MQPVVGSAINQEGIGGESGDLVSQCPRFTVGQGEEDNVVPGQVLCGGIDKGLARV